MNWVITYLVIGLILGIVCIRALEDRKEPVYIPAFVLFVLFYPVIILWQALTHKK